MRSTFFIKNAWNNIKKNYRFFIPRIICEAGLLAVFYIVFTLKQDERILSLKGGDYIAIFMNIGTVIVIILSVILMLYVNGFLMKQRKHEFGLYNVLGMNKRHISRILFFENSISGLFSVASGILLGMLFYKACSLLICKLLKTSVVFGFYFIKADIIALSALLFVAGSMFIVRSSILSQLPPLPAMKDFNLPEQGCHLGTMAHVFERVFGYAVGWAGMRITDWEDLYPKFACGEFTRDALFDFAQRLYRATLKPVIMAVYRGDTNET